MYQWIPRGFWENCLNTGICKNAPLVILLPKLPMAKNVIWFLSKKYDKSQENLIF